MSQSSSGTKKYRKEALKDESTSSGTKKYQKKKTLKVNFRPEQKRKIAQILTCESVFGEKVKQCALYTK